MSKGKGKMHDLFGGKPQIAPGVNPGVNLDTLKALKCKCGNALFLAASNIYYASPLQSVSGGPTLVQVPLGYWCTKCDKINDLDVSKLPGIKPVVAPESDTEH
jgi:thiol-disulfide isomerase/thioredoxin